MKTLTFRLFVMISLISSTVSSQVDALNRHITEGIKFYDSGEFQKAIESYQNALSLDPNSSLAHYEIALTYLSTQEYELAEKHSRIVLENNNEHLLPAYVSLGNALDLQGKSKEAIETYENGIARFDHYLLHYNHAMTCYESGLLDKAYRSALNAINLNKTHSSSHLILSKIMAGKNSRVKAMLPLYFFLLIEPNTERAVIEYRTLRDYLGHGVTSGSETQINVSVPTGSGDEFASAEMMISLGKAAEHLEENKGKSDLELFALNNERIFNILGEIKKDNTGFWWDFYVDFFFKMSREGLVEPFSYYISISEGESVTDWLQNNDPKFRALVNWLSSGQGNL